MVIESLFCHMRQLTEDLSVCRPCVRGLFSHVGHDVTADIRMTWSVPYGGASALKVLWCVLAYCILPHDKGLQLNCTAGLSILEYFTSVRRL